MKNLISFKPIIECFAMFLGVVSLAMVLPMITDIAHRNYQDAFSFAAAAMIGLFISFNLYITNRGHKEQLTHKHAFVLTAATWIIIPAFASLPFMFSELKLGFTDAYFEAVSGLATCGATVIEKLENVPEGILLWRSMTCWLGGIGFIVLGVAVLPMLQVGGMQLFKTESTDSSEKILPRAAQMSRAILGVYLGVTILAVLFLNVFGMGIFDAICHAMTAISTAGFGNYDSSISEWNSIGVEITMIITMIIGSLPFAVMIQAGRGDFHPLLKDQQVRLFLFILCTAIIFTTLWLYNLGKYGLWQSLRYTVFNVTSAMTTSGFTIGDVNTLGTMAIYFVIVLTYFGGCTGSTAGGIKIFRFQILYQTVKASLKKLIHPNGIFKSKYNERFISDKDVTSVLIMFAIYFVTSFMLVGVMSYDGVDFFDSVQAVSYSIADAGLPIIGYTSYMPLPDLSKWALIAAMLLGRLEFFTILVLFMPGIWRKY